MLIRPAVQGQYPARVAHDSAHAYRVLDFGNDGGNFQWHIVCQEDPAAAHALLDQIFSTYVDMCCFELWCNARVSFIAADGKTIQKQYGFDDGRYTMVFSVYCGIVPSQTEEFISGLSAGQTDSFVVVRPDSSEQGFSVCGFAVEHPEDEIDYTGDLDEEDIFF